MLMLFVPLVSLFPFVKPCVSFIEFQWLHCFKQLSFLKKQFCSLFLVSCWVGCCTLPQDSELWAQEKTGPRRCSPWDDRTYGVTDDFNGAETDPFRTSLGNHMVHSDFRRVLQRTLPCYLCGERDWTPWKSCAIALRCSIRKRVPQGTFFSWDAFCSFLL